MLVKDILARQRPTFSLEFFPPKTDEGTERLLTSLAELMPLKPAYVSVTYGAGGSTRERTQNLVGRIQQEAHLTVVSHLTCVGHSRDEIRAIVKRLSQGGVENILALRGDPPKDQKDFVQPTDGFLYAAELVAFIKANFPHLCVGVAGFPEGHPATPNRLREIEFLKAKVDAGADYIVAQLFFDNRDFYDFCARCELAGITVPIIAGIMPVSSRQGMTRLAELAAGARIPAGLLKAVGRAESDEQVAKIGIHWATEQVRDLLDHNVRGIHFYTLNSSAEVLAMFEALGATDSHRLAL